MSRARQSGFTLIELLVVVATTALLSAILVSSAGRARESGRRSRCAANLRAVAVAWRCYVQEHGRLGWSDPKYNLEFFYAGATCLYSRPPHQNGQIPSPRPMNRYLGIDEANGRTFDPAGERDLDADRRASDVTRCPSDRGCDEMDLLGFPPAAAWFDVTGNSFPMNPMVLNRPVDRFKAPEALIFLAGDLPAYLGANPEPPLTAVWHDRGDERGVRGNAAFVDGHVAYTRFERGWLRTGAYSFVTSW